MAVAAEVEAAPEEAAEAAASVEAEARLPSLRSEAVEAEEGEEGGEPLLSSVRAGIPPGTVSATKQRLISMQVGAAPGWHLAHS